jgi:hypothetical protein
VNGINKYAAESYHKLYYEVYGIQTSILRLTNTIGLNQVLYLMLYGLPLSLGATAEVGLTIAGLICIVVNAYKHARISFRVRFSGFLLISYIAIQMVCFLLSFLMGMMAAHARIPNAWVGLITLIFWMLLSFLLTNLVYSRVSQSHASRMRL